MAAAAASSFIGWLGRVFCRDNPSRFNSRPSDQGCIRLPNRCSQMPARSSSVQAERPLTGKGSNFTIEVPIVRDKSPRSALPIAAQPVSSMNQGTILIVEDDPDILDMLKQLLDEEGHVTLVAADGHKALAVAAEAHYALDLIVTDFNLPNGLNGLETVAQVQANAGHPIPAIILTGDISTESLREIVGHGRLHMNKPVRAKDLINVAQKLLAKPKSRNGTGQLVVVEPLPQALPQLRDTASKSLVYIIDDDTALQDARENAINARSAPRRYRALARGRAASDRTRHSGPLDRALPRTVRAATTNDRTAAPEGAPQTSGSESDRRNDHRRR